MFGSLFPHGTDPDLCPTRHVVLCRIFEVHLPVTKEIHLLGRRAAQEYFCDEAIASSTSRHQIDIFLGTLWVKLLAPLSRTSTTTSKLLQKMLHGVWSAPRWDVRHRVTIRPNPRDIGFHRKRGFVRYSLRHPRSIVSSRSYSATG